MFCNYDFSHFPLVIIKFIGNIENDNEFYEFINIWENLYNNKQNFMFIFDTTKMCLINIKYSILMAKFIKQFKKKEHHYLKKSIIIINSKIIKPIIELIFWIEKPVSPIYITNETLENILAHKTHLLENDISTIINISSIINT